MPDNSFFIEECSELLSKKALRIAFAESATAGRLSFAFSQSKFSGNILTGGLVCYDVYVKEDVLGISKKLIEQFSPESAEVTKEMALSIKRMMKADIAVAVTGLTTEGGSEHPGKPVGTMFYCIVLQDNTTLERKKIFTGDSKQIVDLTIEQIAKTLVHALNRSNGKE